jgi:hypothetical protein
MINLPQIIDIDLSNFDLSNFDLSNFDLSNFDLSKLDIDHEHEIKPLEYEEITSGIKNILLIDDTVYQNEILFNSVNSDTLAIKYNYNSDKNELEKLLTDNFEFINRIGIIFDDSLMKSKLFLNSELFFNLDDLTETQTEYSNNLKFIIGIIKKFNITNLDYLVCGGLKHDNWVKYFSILNKESGVIIGASNDETGNLKYGGDWILESTNEDIANIYWDSKISNYTSTLATSTISTSTTIFNADVSGYTWPITINGGTSSSPIVITLGDDITLNSSSEYFIIGSEYIRLDGGNKKIIINGVVNYPGLVLNGTELSNGYSNITIQNINLSISNASTIEQQKGWICWNYFGKASFSILITNCNSDAKIGPNTQCGFICGRAFGEGNGTSNSSNCEIINCSTSGEILSNLGGGIVGNRTGQNGGVINITNCYSTGNINGVNCGGICGIQIGQNNGIVNIEKCYSMGNIIRNFSSGICAFAAGISNGSVSILNCYSMGNITGIFSGGVCGTYFGYNTNNLCKISGCYSMGNITGTNSGGICGSQVGYNDNIIYTPNVLIENCYTLGMILNNSGSICGGTTEELYTNTPIVNIINCYTLYGPIVSPTLQITPTQTNTFVESISNIWNDSNATNTLIGTPTYDSSGSLVNPVGTTWIDIAPLNNTTPWLFSTFGYSPYTSILTTTFTQSIQQGQKTVEALETTGHTYKIIAINDNLPSLFSYITINSLTGQISVSSLTPPNTYLIKVMKNSNYTITNFELIVKQVPNNNRCNIICVKIKCNEKFIIRLNDVYSRYALIEKYKIIKKPKNGNVSLNSKSKLVYTPDMDYKGKDKFTLLCDNIFPELSIVIKFKIKISE